MKHIISIGCFAEKLIAITAFIFITALPGLASAESCLAELVGPRGRVLETFREWGSSEAMACAEAVRSCREYQLHSGRHRGATCRARRIHQPQYVTRYCSVERVDRRSSRVYIHSAAATSRDEYEAQRLACEKANDECQRARVRMQRCIRL